MKKEGNLNGEIEKKEEHSNITVILQYKYYFDMDDVFIS